MAAASAQELVGELGLYRHPLWNELNIRAGTRECAHEDGLWASGDDNCFVAVVLRNGKIDGVPIGFGRDNSWRPRCQANGLWRFPEKDAGGFFVEVGRAKNIFWCGPGDPPAALIADANLVLVQYPVDHEGEDEPASEPLHLIERMVHCFHRLASEKFLTRVEELIASARLLGRNSHNFNLAPSEEFLEAEVNSPVFLTALFDGQLALLRSDDQGAEAFLFEAAVLTDTFQQEMQAVLEKASGKIKPTWLLGEESARERGWITTPQLILPMTGSLHHRKLPETFARNGALAAVVMEWFRLLRGAFESRFTESVEVPDDFRFLSEFGNLVILDIEAGSHGTPTEFIRWIDVREIGALILNWNSGKLHRIRLNVAEQGLPTSTVELLLSTIISDCSPRYVIGHNIEAFDLPVLCRLLPKVKWPTSGDTMRLSRLLISDAQSHSLDTLRRSLILNGQPLHRPNGRTHEALNDCWDTLGLFCELVRRLRTLPNDLADFCLATIGFSFDRPTVSAVLAAMRARHEVLRDQLVACDPPVLLHPDRAVICIDAVPSWTPSRESLAAEAMSSAAKDRVILLLARELPADSAHTWSPSHIRLCPAAVLREVREGSFPSADDTLLGAALLTADADPRRNFFSHRRLKELPDRRLQGLPEEGCVGCPLDQSEACPVQRSSRQVTALSGFVAVAPKDVRDWAAARSSSTSPLELIVADGRWASRALPSLLGKCVKGLGDLWPELLKKVDEWKTSRRIVPWTALAAKLQEVAKDDVPDAFVDIWLAAENLKAEGWSERIARIKFRPEASGSEVVVEFTSASAALSDVFGATHRIRLVFDHHVEIIPRLKSKVLPTTHLSFTFGVPANEPTISRTATEELPNLLVYCGSRAIGRKSPLRRVSYLRDVISASISLTKRSHKRLVLALSSPPSYWPIEHGSQEARDGWPPFRVVRDDADMWLADRFLGDPAPEGSLLILPAWILFRDPERISKPRPDGVYRIGCDMVLVDGMPFDDLERHQAEEARFRASSLGRDPALSYRFDIRWPLSLADVQAFAEGSPSPVMILDPSVSSISGPRASALIAAFQLQHIGDADDCLGVAFHDSVSQGAATALLKDRQHDTESLLERARDLLSEVWGYSKFREYPLHSSDMTVSQEDILSALFDGRDTLAVLATGGGKSLMYQVPALLAEEGFDPGLTIVLSPLIALMRDQVDGLHRRGVMGAVLINSSLAQEERSLVFESLTDGASNLLFCAPEQLGSNRMRKLVKERDVALIAVDEAHCISQWGHDFRTDYLQVPKFIRKEACRDGQRTFPVLALTATARRASSDIEGNTEGDIITRMELRDPCIVRSDALRDEISLEILDVREDALSLENFRADSSEGNPCLADLDVDLDTSEQIDPEFAQHFTHKFLPLLKYIGAARADAKGLIYCTHAVTTRNLSHALRGFLPDRSFDYYHGSRRNSDKDRVLNWFREGAGNQWVIATTAFGMGVDVDDIAHVVHWDLPASMEEYYQQVGRAARNRQKVPNARALLLYDPSDEMNHHELALRGEVDEGMLKRAFKYLTNLARNSLDGSKIIVDKDGLAHLMGADPEADNIGGTILYYLEQLGCTKSGSPLFERLETTQPCWTIMRTQLIAESTHELESRVLKAFDGTLDCPGIQPAKDRNANYDVHFSVLADSIGTDFVAARRVVLSLMQQGFLRFVPVTQVAATEDHDDAVKKLEDSWANFQRLLFSSQVAADADDRPRPGWPVSRDPKLSPEKFFSLLTFLQENAKRSKRERAVPRWGRLRTPNGETPIPFTQRELDEALSGLRACCDEYIPKRASDRESLDVGPLLTHGLDDFPRQERRRNLALLALEHLKLCELDRGNDLSIGIRLNWLLDGAHHELDSAPILKRLSERRQLELRKLRLVHNFASLTNRDSQMQFIRNYFNGHLSLLCDDAQSVRNRLIEADNSHLDEKQRSLVLELPLSHGAIISGLGGSGKTEVLARRYLALVWLHDVPPERMLLLSAHRVSFATLRQRIITLSAGHVRAPQARTVHSLGERLLRQFGYLLPFHAPKKLDDKGCKKQLHRLVEKWAEQKNIRSGREMDNTREAIAKDISRGFLHAKQYPGEHWRTWRDEGIFQKDQDNVTRWESSLSPERDQLVWDCESLRAIAVDYSNWKILNGVFDFDDQIHLGYAVAQYLSESGMADELRANWQHVMLDEVQDLTPLAVDLVRKIFPSNMIFACGDEGQCLSVSSDRLPRWPSLWRPDNNETVVYATLKKNYRQPTHILAVAVDVLSDHPEHTASAKSGGRVGSVSVPILEHGHLDVMLPRRLGGMIRMLIEDLKSARRYSDVAVICDKQRTADELAAGLTREKIPVCQIRDRLKDHQPATAWARIRLLQLWRTSTQNATYGAVRLAIQALLHQALNSNCPAASRKMIDRLITSEPSPEDLARALGGKMLRRGLLPLLVEVLTTHEGISRDDTNRLANQWANACIEIDTSDRIDEGDAVRVEDPDEFIGRANSVEPADEVLRLQEYLPEYEHSVMTSGRVFVAYPHAVKSMQFPIVFCVWPYYSKDPAWRRQLYVAMSRSTEHLVLVGSEFVTEFQKRHPETFRQHVHRTMTIEDFGK